MSQIIIDNWLGGISFSDRLGREGSYFIGKAVNPVHPLFQGYLTAGPNPTNISSTPTKINSMEIDAPNSNVYLIEKNADSRIHKYRITTEDISSSGVFPYTIYTTGTTSGEDVKIYPIGSTYYLFYSYNGYSSTQGQVGRYDLAATFDDDFMWKAAAGGDALATAYPHPMLEWGSSGYLYIADGRFLHQFDGQTGANGTFTNERYALPYGWVATSLFDAGEFIGITAQYYPKSGWSWGTYQTRAAVFFWDGSSPQYNKRVPVEDPEIRASKVVDGEYFIYGKNALGEGTIRKWDGNSFALQEIIRTNIASLGIPSKYSRFPLGYGNVDAWKNMAIISADLGEGNSEGDVFLYGKPKAGLPPALYSFSTGEDVGGVAMYALKVLQTNMLISSRDTGAGTNFLSLISFGLNNNPNFLYKSLYYEFPSQARLNYVEAYFQTLAAGQGDDIYVDINYKDQKQMGNISFAGDGAVETKQLSAKNIKCNALRLVVDKDEGAGIKYGKFIIDYDIL